MVSFPKRFLDDIRDRLRLSEVIGARIPLKKAGREYKACCPFHNEDTPSFTINDDKGFYHCFGCGAHGDVIGFVMRYNNLSFPETVEELAREAGLEVPQLTPQEIERQQQARDLYDVMETAVGWFQQRFWAPEGKVARDYMLARGFTIAQLEAFRIGFAPASWDDFPKAMQVENIQKNDLMTLGLVKETAGRGVYAFFRGRVIFPVLDRKQRPVAIGGRHLDAAFTTGQLDGDFTPPKYLNSPDNPLFHKGQLLYNMGQARAACDEKTPPIVVEGYTDVMALVQAGIETAVAPLGTALTEEQIVLLWRMQPEDAVAPVLCFDGDKAGQKAAYRAVDRALPLLQAGRGLGFLFLPNNHDPDSFLKAHGVAAFQALLQSAAVSLDELLWQREISGRRLETPEAKAGLKKRMEGHIARIQDRSIQKYYMLDLNRRLYAAFGPQKRMQRNRSPQAASGFAAKTSQALPGHKVAPLQGQGNRRRYAILLVCVTHHPWLLRDHGEWFGSLEIRDPKLNAYRQALLSCDGLQSSDVEAYLEQQGLGQLRLDLLAEVAYLQAAFSRKDAERRTVELGWQHLIQVIEDASVKGERQALPRLSVSLSSRQD